MAMQMEKLMEIWLASSSVKLMGVCLEKLMETSTEMH